jgi:hypothetical protein
VSVPHANGVPIAVPDGAHATLRAEIEELADIAGDVFSGAVHDHIEAARAAVDRNDPVGARVSLELASAMMDDEQRHPGEWWRK